MFAKRLPLYVAVSAALVYLLTLCWGTTVNSLPLAANVAGWDSQSKLGQPLLWLLTLPLQLLPAGWIPAGLNIFSALCAAVTLGLMARSVQLFPWDCAPPVKRAWSIHLPVLLACGVCGLEFNFWSEATAGSGAMLNQLLLAAVTWCVLEFRAVKNRRWLNAAAVIWGAGMTQSWLFQMNLPLFIGALFWLRGKKKFFRWHFLSRMMLFGLAGFSLYALLPLVNGLNPHSPPDLGAAWTATWFNTKQTLRLLYQDFFTQHHVMGFVTLLFFLVPVLPALIRLEDHGFKNTSKVDRLQTRIYRLTSAVLLLVCLWLAFDPGIRLQAVLQDQFGISLRLLSFSYVNALGIGFLAGKLLFVFQIRPSVRRMHREDQRAESRQRRRVPVIMAAGTALVLLALIARNVPAIVAGNWQPLETYGALAIRSLPAAGGILLGEDAAQLDAVQAALPHTATGGRWQVVELPALPSADYRALLEHRQPSGWLTASNRHSLNVAEEFALLSQLAKTHRLFFLQPGPGELLFEGFYPQPNGIVAELKPYAADWAVEPPLSEAALAAGETFWDAAWSQHIERLRVPEPKRPSLWTKISGRILRKVHLEPMADAEGQTLAGWYSSSLDAWGVALQRGAKLPAAQRRFEAALALNTNNWSAFVNRQANTNLQAGNTLSLGGVNLLNAAFQDLPHLAGMMTTHGPVDEPGVCYQLGRYFQAAGWPRQAVQQLERCRALAAETLPPDFALLEIYSQSRQDEKVFAGVKALRPRLGELPAEQLKMAAVKLDLLEAKSWMSQTNPANASRILQSMLEAQPNDATTADMVWGAYLFFGDLTNALQLATKQLADNPKNPQLLNNQAGLLVMMNRADEAVASLQHSLAITNSPDARLNLAIAYFKAQNFSAAEAEYRRLETESADGFRIHSGLADIALQRRDTNAAMQELELSLTNVPNGSPRWVAGRSRLNQFKSSLLLGKRP